MMKKWKMGASEAGSTEAFEELFEMMDESIKGCK